MSQRMSIRLMALTLAGSLLGGLEARAQEPSSPVPVPGAYQGGYLVFQSQDSAFKYWLDGRIQIDEAQYFGSKNSLGSGTHVRRARLGVKTTLFRNWQGEIDVDFAGNEVEVKDLWVGYAGFDNTLIRIGNYKEPFSLETLTSSKYITFLERSYIDAFSPDRHIGASISRWGRRWQASAGVFGQEGGDVDASGQTEAWAVTARVTGAPILSDRRVLHIGGAFSRRTPNADVPGSDHVVRFRARPETVVNQARFLTTGKIKNSDYTLYYNGEVAIVHGSLSLQGEYTGVSIHRLKGLATASFDGGYGSISYFLTGESRPYAVETGEFERVVPRSSIGAWEIAARYSTMSLNDPSTGVNIAGGRGQNYTLGVNWYVNANFKFMVDYVRVVTDQYAVPDGGTAPFVPGDKFNIIQARASLAL